MNDEYMGDEDELEADYRAIQDEKFLDDENDIDDDASYWDDVFESDYKDDTND